MTEQRSSINFSLSVFEIWQIIVVLFSVIGGGTYWFTTTISDTVKSLAVKQSEMVAQASADRAETRAEIMQLREQLETYLFNMGKK